MRRRAVLAAGFVTVAAAGLWALWARRGPPVHALAWEEGEGYRWAALEVPAGGQGGFERMAGDRLGIDFRNELTEGQIVANRNLLNGSGVALGDVTGNGFVDVYFAGLDGANRLYENLGGWRFRDITEVAGVALAGQFSTGAVFADLDGDGPLDLVVSAIGSPPRIFLNDGRGRFTEKAGALVADTSHGGASIALADVTGNGALDIYVANYKERSVRDVWPYEQRFRFLVEEVDGEYRLREKYRDHYRLAWRDSVLVWFEEGQPDLLFLNGGAADFTPVPLDSGVLRDETGAPLDEPLRDWGLHARFHDLNGDLRPDLYVANDFESPDRIWMNRGDGTFEAAPRTALRKTSLSSMAVDFSDVDRDGHVDILVVEMLSPDHAKRLRQMATAAPSRQPPGAVDNRPQVLGNTLFMGRGDGTWAETAELAGIRRSDWSWSSLFVDVDLDGYEDVLVGTGHHYDVQDLDTNRLIRRRMASGRLDLERLMLRYPGLAEPNAAFRNRGDGTFEAVTTAWGLGEPDVSHGMALGDLDHDGAPDLVVNRLGYEAAVYRNTASAPRVAVRLRGRPPNTRGTGSVVRFLGGPVPQWKEVAAGGTYLSGSDATSVFAAGEDGGPFTLEVAWRSGKTSRVEDVRPDRIYEIVEPEGAAPAPPGRMAGSRDPAAAPASAGRLVGRSEEDGAGPSGGGGTFFQDVSGLLDHVHVENAFPDFERQPLLPWRPSRLGPGVAWFDATGDGMDDLFVGSGTGGEAAWFRNRSGGSFRRVAGRPLGERASRDQAGVVGWWDGEGDARLLVGSSSWEDADRTAEAAYHFRLTAGGAEPVDGIPGGAASTGALALADYTGNGRVDLFVGGRVVPGRYPEPASSRLFVNRDGHFELDRENTALLEDVGLVTGAVFSDLDGDGAPELILAREWGSPLVWTSRDGVFRDVTASWGLDGYAGWWTGVATGDLDGDGRPDIVAGNWGLNHAWAGASGADRPVRIHYGDLDGSGSLELIESYHPGGSDVEMPRRGLTPLARQMGFIGDRFGTHREFARASMDEVLGGRRLETSSVEAAHFEHTVFWNRGDGFQAEPLPMEAQRAPAFHVAVADLSGDGNEDVLLSQNFFSYRSGVPRSDAGRALWLRGDGSGGLTPVPGQRSGLLVYGEQRGAALADFDADGRVDLAISQNGNRTRLFRNRLAAPGLRVRLRGPSGNPGGIGAAMRLVYGDGEGPLREVQAGSGYWSQNSAVQVLGRRGTPDGLQVRWPFGDEILYPLPEGVSEVVAGVDGSLRIVRDWP